MIRLTCSGCSTLLQVKPDLAGRRIQCPRCRHVNHVPETSAIGVASGPQQRATRASVAPLTAAYVPNSGAGGAGAEAATMPPADSSEAATIPPQTPAADTATLPPRSVSAEPAPPAANVTVPGYEILGELGRGGMGVVYQARQAKLGRLVALKMILAGGHAAQADLARFRTEAEAIARLQHPGIVQIHEIGEHQGLPFFSLEFCSGGSLEKKLAGTPLPPQEAAALVQKLAGAMEAAHQKGVIHRDLKPANVLLAEDGTPKITDFGLAKKLDEAGQTQSGSVMGTPSYMAPEQAGGSKEIGPAADVYALGAILYECLTGRPPFKAATPLDTVLQVVSDEPVSPTQLNARVARDLETICLKCLNKEPARRYASAAELAEDLRRFQAGEPITARPVSRMERAAKWVRRHKGLSAGLTAAVLALLLGTGVATWFAIKAEANAARADREAEAARRKAEAETKAKRVADDARQAEATAHQQTQREHAEVVRHLDRARRFLCTAQLMRVATVMDRDPDAGLELLHDYNACPLNLRDFAWNWYERRCHRGKPRILEGHTNAVTTVAFSNDGKLLASGSGQYGPRATQPFPGEVKVWDVVTGKEKVRLQGHTGNVTCVVFSPDGKLLASARGGFDGKTMKYLTGEIKLWDVATGKEKATLGGYPGGVFCLAFSPDGRLLASGTGGEDHKARKSWGEVRVWDVATCKEKLSFKGHAHQVSSVAFSHNGKLLASASILSVVKLWDMATGKEKATLKGHSNAINCVAFSPDDKLLASGSADKTVKLWDVASGQVKSTLTGHTGSVRSVVFNDDGKLLVSGGGGYGARVGKRFTGEVKVWDVASGQEKASLPDHTGIVTSVALRGDGNLLASGSEDKTIRLWDGSGSPEKAILKEHNSPVVSVVFCDGGKLLASGSGGYPGEIRLWDVATCLGKSIFHTYSIKAMAVSSDGKHLATACVDGRVRLWNVARGQLIATFAIGQVIAHDHALAFSPDGKLLASASAGTYAKLWDLASHKLKATLRGGGYGVSCVAFSPDGKLLASYSTTRLGKQYAGEVKLWDVASGQPKAALTGHPSYVLSVAFGGDGKLLASASEDGKVRLWDVATHQLKATLTGHTGAVRCVAFSRDGKLLASGSADKTVKLWDVASGQLRATLTGHTRFVNSVAFREDSKLLASASFDNTVRLWDVDFAIGQANTARR